MEWYEWATTLPIGSHEVVRRRDSRLANRTVGAALDGPPEENLREPRGASGEERLEDLRLHHEHEIGDRQRGEEAQRGAPRRPQSATAGP